MQQLIDVGIELAVPHDQVERIEATLYIRGEIVHHGILRPGRLPIKAPLIPEMRAILHAYQRECPKRGRAIKRLGYFRREPYHFYHLGKHAIAAWMNDAHEEVGLHLHAVLRKPMAPGHPPLLYYRAAAPWLHPFGPPPRYRPDRAFSCLTPHRMRSVELRIAETGLAVRIIAIPWSDQALPPWQDRMAA